MSYSELFEIPSVRQGGLVICKDVCLPYQMTYGEFTEAVSFMLHQLMCLDGDVAERIDELRGKWLDGEIEEYEMTLGSLIAALKSMDAVDDVVIDMGRKATAVVTMSRPFVHDSEYSNICCALSYCLCGYPGVSVADVRMLNLPTEKALERLESEHPRGKITRILKKFMKSS